VHTSAYSNAPALAISWLRRPTTTKHDDAASAALVQLRYHYLSLSLCEASTGSAVHASNEESCEVLNALLGVAQEAEGVAIESMKRVRAMIEDMYQAFDDGKKRKKPQERWEGGKKSRSS